MTLLHPLKSLHHGLQLAIRGLLLLPQPNKFLHKNILVPLKPLYLFLKPKFSNLNTSANS
jgi:hypothetical protein